MFFLRLYKRFTIPTNNNEDIVQNNFRQGASFCINWQEEPEHDSQSELEEVGSPRSTDSKGSSRVFSCDEATYVPGEDGAMAMEHDEDACSDISSPEDKDTDSDSDTLELPGKDPISVQIRKRRRMKSMDDDKDRVYKYVTSDSSLVYL